MMKAQRPHSKKTAALALKMHDTPEGPAGKEYDKYFQRKQRVCV